MFWSTILWNQKFRSVILRIQNFTGPFVILFSKPTYVSMLIVKLSKALSHKNSDFMWSWGGINLQALLLSHIGDGPYIQIKRIKHDNYTHVHNEGEMIESGNQFLQC